MFRLLSPPSSGRRPTRTSRKLLGRSPSSNKSSPKTSANKRSSGKKHSGSKRPTSTSSAQGSPGGKTTLVETLGQQARAFGLHVDSRGLTILIQYIRSCLAKLIMTLETLAKHAGRSAIDERDMATMTGLSKCFLSMQPIDSTKMKRVQQHGGSTSLPIQYFGGTNSAYHTSAGEVHTALPTETLTRPALPQSGGGQEEDDLQLGGSVLPQDILLSRAALTELLASVRGANTAPLFPIKDSTFPALCWILTCNMLNLWMKIKSERKKSAVARRGAPVTTGILNKAVDSTPFVIPI